MGAVEGEQTIERISASRVLRSGRGEAECCVKLLPPCVPLRLACHTPFSRATH